MTVNAALRSLSPSDDTAPIAAADRHRGRWSRRVAADIIAAVDGLAIALTATLPVSIYATFGGIEPNWVLTLQSGLAAAIISVLLLRSWGMYDPAKLGNLPENPGCLLAATLLGLLAVLGLGLPYAIKEAHLWVWYAAWASAAYTILLANRGIAKFMLQRLTAAGRFDQRVAVYGAGPIARRVHDHLSGGSLGIHFVGVFDDRIGEDRINPEGLKVAGRLDDLIRASREDAVDQIIVALPQIAQDRIASITRTLERLPVDVHIVTHIASDLVDNEAQHKVSSLGPVGLLDVKRKALSGWQPVVKRAEDILLSGLFLLVTAPLYPLIAAAIWLESGGPVLFRQRRRGFNGRDIEVYKFRTMRVLENGEAVVQATEGDARVTRVGRVLRRFSLDELPQLFNVLKGEMSLVGPRPHAVAHDEEFASKLENYASRHQVRPGITGLAQVNGCRGPTETTEKLAARVAHDIAYVKEWSLWLDLKIIARTLWVVISGKNAI